MLRDIVFSLVIAAFAAGVAPAEAQPSTLTFEFTIDDQIAGSRPWDGTGVDPAAVDVDGGGGLLGNVLSIGSTAAQAGLNQYNERIAAPDPMLCIILARPILLNNGKTTPAGTPVCPRSQDLHDNTLSYIANLAQWIATEEFFGVVLLDRDMLNIDPTHDLIGMGVFINERVRNEIVQNNNSSVRNAINTFERSLPGLVEQKFATSRSLGLMPSIGGRTNAAVPVSKLSISRCKDSCRFGDSTLKITDSVDGW